MRKVRLLAACAAISLLAAACGDDDDDASGDTTAVADAGPAATVAPPTDAPAADSAPAAGAATTPPVEGSADAAVLTVGPVPTMPGGDASPEVVADCEVVGEFVQGQDEGPGAPEIGDEISDDYKDFLRGVVDDLEDLDIETDEVQEAIDALADFANEAVDADTWTEELSTAGAESFTPLNNSCAATFIAIDEASEATEAD